MTQVINEAAASVSLEGIAAGVRAVDTVIKAQLADVFAQRRSIEVAFDYLDVGEVAVAQSLAHDRVQPTNQQPGNQNRS